MPEHDCLPPDLTATDLVSHLGQMSGLPRAAARERTAEVLRHVGLYEERYRPIGTYSTGMKQRVKLAQALVHDPRLLLLDEPTNGLDPAGRDEMLELVRRTGTEFGIAVIVASHLLGEIERVCDFLVALDAGHLLRAAPLGSFTERTGVLAVEVEEGRERAGGGARRAGADGRAGWPPLLVALQDEGRTTSCGMRWSTWPAPGAHRAPTPQPGGPVPRRGPARRRVTDPIGDPADGRHAGPAAASTTLATRAITVGGWPIGRGRGAVLADAAGLLRHRAWRPGEDRALHAGRPGAPPGHRGRRASRRSSPRPGRAARASRSLAHPVPHVRGVIAVFVMLFCAAQAPELFGRDQRYGVLPLYFSRALARTDYAIARPEGWSPACC